MADATPIEWTNATWNPTTGCERVSPGCDNCYALRFAERFRGVPGHYFEHGFDVQLRENMLKTPEKWKSARYVFVNSMSDLFHRAIPDSYIARVFDVMERVDHHIYQVLSKRPERMLRFLKNRYYDRPVPRHIWIGTTVENNSAAWRVDVLRQIDARTRFMSVEPMIGPIDAVSLAGISWVIVGGESGPKHRPMDIAWIREVRDRCEQNGIPFFFKQWHKRGTGRVLDKQTWDGMPPSAPIRLRKMRRRPVRRLSTDNGPDIAL
ncbi:MAG TPA: phage Gp37/Gp68 family protein [Candidatus Elarobacter sp.]|jgi:protein gp37